MSWLNLNESFNSLKGQITNFASEVLSEAPNEEQGDNTSKQDSTHSQIEEKCRNQELEIASLKQLTEELQTALRAEVLTALFFFATGSYQRPVGVAKHMSQKMCSVYIEQVTQALTHKNILSKYIRFPDTPAARQAISQRFYIKYGMPGVVGCIDGSHFKIVVPRHEEEHSYYSRKHYHSLNVQMTLAKQNGVKEDEGSWYWDPPPQRKLAEDLENQYQVQIRTLQNEITTLRERDTIDLRPDTEEELNRLREENKNLATNLDDLDTQHQQAMERLLTLKKELHQNFEVLKQDHEDLKNSNDEYAAEIKLLLEKVGDRDKEIEYMRTIKSEYDTLHHKYQNLERVHSLLKENAEKFQEDNQELHEEVFNLQEQVTKLEHDLELATKNIELLETVPKTKYNEVLKELNSIRDSRNANLTHLDEINIDDNAKSVIENLKRDINKLKHELAQKSETQDIIDHKWVKSDKVMQLYNKYVNFEIPLDYVGEMPSGNDNVILFKLESVFKTVNSFKKQIDTLEHQLSEKNLNVNHLQTQIDDLTTENDFLTTDIQHFEQELSEMKKNNDFLISEIAVLKNASKLEPIIETHEDNLAKLETELDACNNMNKTFESEIKRIEKELEIVNLEKKSLQESLSDLKTKYTTMLSEIEMCKNKTEAVEELETSTHVQEIEKLQKVVDEIDDLKNQLNAANSKNEQLSIDIHIIENDKVLLTKQIEDLKCIQKENTSSQKDLEALKHTMDYKLQEFDHKMNEIAKQKDAVEMEKLNLQEKVSVLESQLAIESSAVTEIEKLTTEKSHLAQKLNQVLKENSTLVSQIQSLQSREQDLVTQNNNLKAGSKIATGNATTLLTTAKETIDPCVVKIIQQQDLFKEITTLKQENHKLHQRNTQLEVELSSTDSKILHLDEEFAKLKADINEKDELIDELNNVAREDKLTIHRLNNTVTEQEQSKQEKNEELERLRLRAESLSVQIVNMRERFNQSQEELHIVRENTHDIGSELSDLRDELNLKNNEISALATRLEQAEKSCDEYHAAMEAKDKEILELKETVNQLTENFKTNSNINQDLVNVVEEKETILNVVNELKNMLTLKDKEVEKLRTKTEELNRIVDEHRTSQDNATAEKTELINLINLKHNESIQYHGEIQRLNAVLLEQSNEMKRLAEQTDKPARDQPCANCERLKTTLEEKDRIIVALNSSASEWEQLKQELQNTQEVVSSLTQKCEALDRELSTQLDAVNNLTAENAKLSAREEGSSRELSRLRAHLADSEAAHTQELVAAERRLADVSAQLARADDRHKHAATLYTSNSIRANQEVETLRAQIKLLERQREDSGAAREAHHRAALDREHALCNLQRALEHFQEEKDRDIEAATEKIRNKMEELKQENASLRGEMSALNGRLEEAAGGLSAAARLADQLHHKTALIADLKDQVRALEAAAAAAAARCAHAHSPRDRVDKDLVKNLLLNYLAASHADKRQVVSILSTVLDFNQQECERAGLARGGGGGAGAAGVTGVGGGASLAAEFVRFLQTESTPRAPATPAPPVPPAPASRKTSTATGPPTPTPTPPPPVPQLEGHRRTPSAGSSSNLLLSTLAADAGLATNRNTEGAILTRVLRDM